MRPPRKTAWGTLVRVMLTILIKAYREREQEKGRWERGLCFRGLDSDTSEEDA